MASGRRQVCTNEKRGVRTDWDSWRCKLVACLGVEKILEVLLETRILEELRLFKDYKPASVSNWSFDENCLFCCLRREKVKEHVVALNNKIVESGGKPLLGKEDCNISRLEWQVEEFLNAVLHKKEYTPRIPDPHIPVVACDTMQQMIDQLVHYTSSKNSQDVPQHNGNTDQSLLKAPSIKSPATTAAAATATASAQNPVLSNLLMADQDAPLDLSVKKVKPEIPVQDGVLDLSIKKNRSQDSTPPRKSPVNFSSPFFTGDSVDPSLSKGKDLQSVATLEQFMAKLCLHHQRQIVDAFGYLQAEVKSVASPNKLSSPVASEKAASSGCPATLEQSKSQESKVATHTPTAALSKSAVEESSVAKKNEFVASEQPLNTEASLIASVKTGPSIDLAQVGTGDEVMSSPNAIGTDHNTTNVQPKCPTLLIVKNRNSGNLEAKNLPEVELTVECPNTGTPDLVLCTPVKQSLPNSSGPVVDELSSPTCVASKCCNVQKSLPTHNKDSSVRPCTVQRTSNVLTISSKTARKSKRLSQTRRRDSPVCQVINDPDVNYDIIYVEKPITECELQSHNRMLPRRNARKSTRGHLYIGECWELKTVRTLARKPAENGSGNCPVPMPEMTTSVTPKQALAKPDGVPPMDVPFTGDCMETVLNKKPPDQPIDTEMPGDTVEIANEDLVVEPSQTGQIQSKDSLSPLCEQSATDVEQDINAAINDNVDLETEQENLKDSGMSDVNGLTENTDFASGVMLEAEVQSPNKEPDEVLGAVFSDTATEDASDECREVEKLKDKNAVKDGFQSKTPEQTECLEMQVMTTSDKNAEVQVTCRTETSLSPEDGTKSAQDNVVESRISDASVEEETKLQPEECKEEVVITESSSSKKVIAKPATPSDRCLRSRGSKPVLEQTVVSNNTGKTELTASQINVGDKTPKKCKNSQELPETKQPLKTQKLKPDEDTTPCQDGQNGLNATENINHEKTQSSPVKQSDGVVQTDNMVTASQKQNVTIVTEAEVDKEQTPLEEPNQKDNEIGGQGCSSHRIPENVGNPPESDEPPENDSPSKSLSVAERMPLRSSSSKVQQPAGRISSPVKTSTHSSERMPLRSRSSSAVDQPVKGDSCGSPSKGHSEGVGRMPLRSRMVGEKVVCKDSPISPNKSSSESVARMPLRSKSSSTTDQTASRDSSDVLNNGSSSHIAQSVKEDVSIKSKKLESTGHMPLRSGNGTVAEPPSSSSPANSSVGNALESPGRMSLRRSYTADKLEHSPTPSKSKTFSQKHPRLSKAGEPSSVLEGESSPNTSNAKIKSSKLKDHIKDSSLPESSFISISLPPVSQVIPSPSKFLEVLNGEENQQLISDLNAKFDKMHKGWVQMDKEGQPAPRPKNRADRLKEIWKSKKRIRKPRPLEQQKFSPVQMLFMKSFDLPSICQWFLQSTETKSLVIVKKVNTRLPSETQLCFTSASVPGSSNGVFPSLQAERLKKHLKKFAIASPVKSNAKNKRLIAKALAQNTSVAKSKEKQGPRTATRISTKRQSCTGLIQTQPSDGHGKLSAGVKNPASARILRKYSNIREKMQVQQNTLKYLEGSVKKTNKMRAMPKSVSKEKLATGRGQNSAIVRKVKALAKKAKVKSAVKEKVQKRSVNRTLRDLKNKDGELKISKFNSLTETKATNKKESPSKTERSPQTKPDIRKSPKVSDGAEPRSQNADVRPLLSEDQVLTRSQRKIEATFMQTGSPKLATKRGNEPLDAPAKRTRTSK